MWHKSKWKRILTDFYFVFTNICEPRRKKKHWKDNPLILLVNIVNNTTIYLDLQRLFNFCSAFKSVNWSGTNNKNVMDRLG